jgi:Zn-dependent protease
VEGTEKIAEFAVWFVVFLLSLSIHEASHALVAWLGGDDMAYRGGQVSLNPLPHIRREPFGTIVIPLLTFFSSGWMMGWASTPYDPHWADRHPRRLAAMSAAGPASNLMVATLAFAVLRVLLHSGTFVAPATINFSHLVEPVPGTPEGSLAYPLAFGLSVALNLNLLQFLFNLIPLPPLDGSGILQGLFPDSIGGFLKTLARNPVMSIVGLLVAWQVFDVLYRPVFDFLLRVLHPGHAYA